MAPAALLLLMLLCASPVSAQEIPCSAGPCIQGRRPGTHFIAEVYGGGNILGDGGLAIEGVFGAGGRPFGLPLRLYALAELSYSTSMQTGTWGRVGLGFRDERDYRDIGLGLRIYLPLWGPLRLFADALGGTCYESVSLERAGLSTLSASGWLPMGAVAAGLQLRLFHHLSLGLRSRVVLTTLDVGELHAAVGKETPYRTSVTAGLTWHF